LNVICVNSVIAGKLNLASGRCGLPRRLVSPEPCAKAEAATKAADPRLFEKISFF
jgi:hypothetical protein